MLLLLLLLLACVADQLIPIVRVWLFRHGLMCAAAAAAKP
jgi:hypothetical protein